MLNQRIKLCEYASNLYERSGSMPKNELHRCITPLLGAGIEFPIQLQTKLLTRHCLEMMPEDLEGFFVAWTPWELEGEEASEEFNPIKPDMRSLVGSVADREMEARQEAKDDDNADKSACPASEFTIAWQASCIFPFVNFH